MPTVITPGSPESVQQQDASADNADEDTTGADAGDDGDDGDDQSDDGPVTFETKDAFVKHVNTIVKKRLQRNEQKYAPIVTERDTLKTRVAELEGSDQQASQAEQTIAKMQKQLDDLLNYQTATQRNELVRNIAKEHGLPDEFLARVQGDDEDSITEDVEQLVNLLKIDGKPPTKVSKTTKPAGKDGKGGKGTDGKGGAEDDARNDPYKIAAEVGRYGHRPIVVG
jgi:uncharacterized protein YdcH (DUF465 family)